MAAESKRYHDCCHGKKRYSHLDQAKDVARIIKQRCDAVMRPYECHICRGFHLSSQEIRS